MNGENICGHHNQLHHNAIVTIACAIRSSSYTQPTSYPNRLSELLASGFSMPLSRICLSAHSIWAYNASLLHIVHVAHSSPLMDPNSSHISLSSATLPIHHLCLLLRKALPYALAPGHEFLYAPADAALLARD